MKDCTILVNSCDAYEDLWAPFFTLLKKNWPACPYPIVLNTETKAYHNDDIDVRTVPLGEKAYTMSWSMRLYKVLQTIKTPYVIFLLDDFFIEQPVDMPRLEQCIAWMKNDKKIASFSFAPSLWPDVPDNRFPGFVLRGRNTAYKANCQAAVWRTDVLRSLLRKKETPWEFEEYATVRANHTRLKYYAAQKDSKMIIAYDWMPGGAVHRGKWTRHVPALFTDNHIDIDLSRRGMDEAPLAKYETQNLQVPCFYRYQLGRIWGMVVKKIRK